MTAALNELELQSLIHKVYVAARDGMAISIFAMLWNLDRESVVNKVLNHETCEDGQTTTPLIIAARNGEEKVVQVLLSNFDTDIEQTGTVMFDGYAIEGATALWCAAGAGHFNIVRLLVDHDSGVNHATVTNSTPLRAACFDGRLDIVKFLVDHGADITLANKYHNTCLMISCYKGHTDVVEYLLQKGADPNARAHCGATSLHFSAECGHTGIVKLLINYGASLLENDHEMTPLTISAECGRSDIVEYLVSLPECSRTDKIDGLELLGASFANDKDTYDIAKAYSYLEQGMKERYSDPNNVLKKDLKPPVPAYDNRIECQTLKELEEIQTDNTALHMESLTIRERILGADNPEIPHPVIFRGAVFADGARFNKCIALWLHALSLRQNSNRSVSKDLLRFAQVFSQIVHLKVPLSYKHVEEVLMHSIREIQVDIERIAKTSEAQDTLHEIYQANIHTCVYLLVIANNLTKSEEEIEQFHRYVYKFLQTTPALRNGYTPLHMAVDSATIVDDFHVNEVVTFPNSDLAELLIACGADVNALDNQRNTPMHVIVRYTNPISDFNTLHHAMIVMIKNGAHMDICNLSGQTPIEAATTGVAEVIIRTNCETSLKCLAAKAIKRQNVLYEGMIPKVLEEFLELH